MIRGLLFDLNGTLIDILTDEGSDEIYRILSNLLEYQGILLSPKEFRDRYWEINKRQRRESSEEYPEFDVVGIFREILEKHSTLQTCALPESKCAALPRLLAETFRSVSRFRLELYPGVKSTLDLLKPKFPMAALSDGQSVWARPELESVGLSNYFSNVFVSSDFGYRKPDRRLFEAALSAMRLPASEVIYIGNDMYRDVWGAHECGMKTVYFQSNQGDQTPHGAEPDYIIYRFEELPRAISFLS